MFIVKVKSISQYCSLILFLTFSACSPKTSLLIPEQKLDGIFNSGSCGFYSQPFDRSVLWETDEGTEFLLKKLNSKYRRDQVMAITFLGQTKNPDFIDVIAPYLKSSDRYVAQNTVQALSSIGTPETLVLLQAQLLTADKNEGGLILNLLGSLKRSTDTSSLPYLNSFINICDTSKMVEAKYINKAKKIAKLITDYNGSPADQKAMMAAYLISENPEDCNWARTKLYQNRDTSDLPLLRKFINKTGQEYNRRSLLKLMMLLGEKNFTEKDQLVLDKMKDYEKAIKERTRLFLKKSLTSRVVSDF